MLIQKRELSRNDRAQPVFSLFHMLFEHFCHIAYIYTQYILANQYIHAQIIDIYTMMIRYTLFQ